MEDLLVLVTMCTLIGYAVERATYNVYLCLHNETNVWLSHGTALLIIFAILFEHRSIL